jgi:hypothetical protein
LLFCRALKPDPLSPLGGFLEPEYYLRIAETLERGKFDLSVVIPPSPFISL